MNTTSDLVDIDVTNLNNKWLLGNSAYLHQSDNPWGLHVFRDHGAPSPPSDNAVQPQHRTLMERLDTDGLNDAHLLHNPSYMHQNITFRD